MHRLSTWSTKSKIIMKNLTKLTFALFAFILLFTACSSSDDDTLLDYVIIEEYKPKASAPAEFGDKPILIPAYIEKNVNTGEYSSIIDFTERIEMQTTYDASTGITSINTVFGYYDFTRDASGQIVVIKSRHNEDSNYRIVKYFDSQYLQLVKKTQSIYDNTTYKNVTGNGYYRFRSSDNKWRWKENAVPTTAELIWSYTKHNNNVWVGSDGGTEQWYNIFISLPKGNGWKGQYKDKDLLIVSVQDYFYYRAIGDIGVYEINN